MLHEAIQKIKMPLFWDTVYTFFCMDRNSTTTNSEHNKFHDLPRVRRQCDVRCSKLKLQSTANVLCFLCFCHVRVQNIHTAEYE